MKCPRCGGTSLWVIGLAAGIYPPSIGCHGCGHRFSSNHADAHALAAKTAATSRANAEKYKPR